MKNTTSLGDLNLNVSVILINTNEINFPSTRQRFSCLKKSAMYTVQKTQLKFKT